MPGAILIVCFLVVGLLHGIAEEPEFAQQSDVPKGLRRPQKTNKWREFVWWIINPNVDLGEYSVVDLNSSDRSRAALWMAALKSAWERCLSGRD